MMKTKTGRKKSVKLGHKIEYEDEITLKIKIE